MKKFDSIITILGIIILISLLFCEYTLLFPSIAPVSSDGQSGMHGLFWLFGKMIVWPLTAIILFILFIVCLIKKRWRNKYALFNLILFLVLLILWTFSPDISILSLWK